MSQAAKVFPKTTTNGAGTEAAPMPPSRYRETTEELRKERDELKRMLKELGAVVVKQQRLISTAEERAEKAQAALGAVTGVLEEEGIDIRELHLIAARARAAQDPSQVFEALPRDLRVIFAGLDPDFPQAAEIALSGLRRGSVGLLEDFGVCSFGEPDSDGVMNVSLSSRAWEIAKLAQDWFLADMP